MNPIKKNRVGKTDLFVTSLGLGCSGLARSDSIERAIETVNTAIQQGINYLDTAPLYGRGISEERLGLALNKHSRTDLVLSTKVGRRYGNTKKGNGENVEMYYDYSKEAVTDSIKGSLERMGIESVDILFIHDPDNHYEQAISEAYPLLAELRDEGVVKAIGAGMNQWEMELQFAKDGDFDCFLLAGRYTLLEQGALSEFLTYCAKNNISVIIGGPYNSGVIANPHRGRYNYREAPPEIASKVIKMNEVCMKYDVPIKAAALQFVMGHSAIASVIPGTSSPEHQLDNYRMMSYPIPRDLWVELKEEQLLEGNAPTPD